MPASSSPRTKFLTFVCAPWNSTSLPSAGGNPRGGAPMEHREPFRVPCFGRLTHWHKDRISAGIAARSQDAYCGELAPSTGIQPSFWRVRDACCEAEVLWRERVVHELFGVHAPCSISGRELLRHCHLVRALRADPSPPTNRIPHHQLAPHHRTNLIRRV